MVCLFRVCSTVGVKEKHLVINCTTWFDLNRYLNTYFLYFSVMFIISYG